MVLPQAGQRRTPSLHMKPFSSTSRNSRAKARLRSGMVNLRSKAFGSTVIVSESANKASNSSRALSSIALQPSSARRTSNPPSAAVLTVIAL